MCTVAIMGNAPEDLIPDLKKYEDEVDIWIGADRGALILIEKGISVSYAMGDFDSIHEKQREIIAGKTDCFEIHPSEKNETDLELALQKAFELNPEKIYLFGVTGGRLDHGLINLQLLHTIADKSIRGIIIDKSNFLELTHPGTHTITHYEHYPYVSFVPITKHVKNLTLTGFYYPLEGYNLSWGSTRCISNQLQSREGTFSYEEGILLLIKSCDIPS